MFNISGMLAHGYHDGTKLAAKGMDEAKVTRMLEEEVQRLRAMANNAMLAKVAKPEVKQQTWRQLLERVGGMATDSWAYRRRYRKPESKLQLEDAYVEIWSFADWLSRKVPRGWAEERQTRSN